MLMNNKAQLLELYVPFVFIFVFLFAAIIGFYVVSEFSDATSSQFSTEANDIVTKGGNAFQILDYGSIILIAGIFMGLIISAFYIQTNPVYFMTFLVALMVVMIVSPAMSNVFNGLKSNPTINATVDTANNFPVLNYVTDNFPLFIALGGFIFIITLFAKPIFIGGSRE